jgi:hypothetical protein
MSKPSSLSYASFVMALLALVLASAGLGTGFAEATGHKIGKNLVVTKSIKKNAVTGAKVKNGSLTAVDLAPGTIPTIPPPPPSRAVGFAGCAACLDNGPNGATVVGFSGFTPLGGVSALPLAAAITLTDVRVSVPTQAAGKSVQLRLGYQAPGAPLPEDLPVCTVWSGASGCAAAGPFSVPAGSTILFSTWAGPSGETGTGIAIGYVTQVG